MNILSRFLKLSVLLLCFLNVIFFSISVQAKENLTSKVSFIENLSGKNKFFFRINLNVDNDVKVKNFFIENGEIIVPIDTYKISDKEYVVEYNSPSLDFSVKDLKLGVTIFSDRTEKNIKGIGNLTGENKNFRSGTVLSDPILLYHNQDSITIAIEIDDPWDSLKNVQAALVYPGFNKNFDVSHVEKYIVKNGELKEYLYITMDGFKANETLKFKITLVIQQSLKDLSLKLSEKVFYYNFDENQVVKDFINKVYMNFFGRNAKSSELNNWFSKLKSKSSSVTNFMLTLVNSKEFKSRNITDQEFIKIAYNVTLNRDPDSDGNKFWSDKIKTTSRYEILKTMLLGNEFIRIMREINLLP